jgi:hypothetical protein
MAGCEPDLDVYIQNGTDQKLYFVFIGKDGSWNEKGVLYPQKTTAVGVLGSGCSTGKYVIAASIETSSSGSTRSAGTPLTRCLDARYRHPRPAFPTTP